MPPYDIAASLDRMYWKIPEEKKKCSSQTMPPYNIAASLDKMTWRTDSSFSSSRVSRGLPLTGVLPASPRLESQDPQGLPLTDGSPSIRQKSQDTDIAPAIVATSSMQEESQNLRGLTPVNSPPASVSLESQDSRGLPSIDAPVVHCQQSQEVDIAHANVSTSSMQREAQNLGGLPPVNSPPASVRLESQDPQGLPFIDAPVVHRQQYQDVHIAPAIVSTSSMQRESQSLRGLPPVNLTPASVRLESHDSRELPFIDTPVVHHQQSQNVDIAPAIISTFSMQEEYQNPRGLTPVDSSPASVRLKSRVPKKPSKFIPRAILPRPIIPRAFIPRAFVPRAFVPRAFVPRAFVPNNTLGTYRQPRRKSRVSHYSPSIDSSPLSTVQDLEDPQNLVSIDFPPSTQQESKNSHDLPLPVSPSLFIRQESQVLHISPSADSSPINYQESSEFSESEESDVVNPSGRSSNKRRKVTRQYPSDDEFGDSERVKKNRRVVTGKPRTPPSHLMVFDTAHYIRYDRQKSTNLKAVRRRFIHFDQYDAYHLFMSANLSRDADIPRIGIRLDDLAISRILDLLIYTAEPRHQFWPADFDKKGMVRATRVSLGYAAKVWVNAGEKDFNGEEISAAEAGWYYYWWRGLHILCGKEGLDAGIYKIRPSHEEFKAEGLVWKKGSRAVLQQAPGTEVR